MQELIDLVKKVNIKQPGFYKIRRTGKVEQFILSDELNKGSYINGNDTILIRDYILPNWLEFSSDGRNIKIIFIKCFIQDGLSINLANEDNKVIFLNCEFKGNVDIKAGELGIFNCNCREESTWKIDSKFKIIKGTRNNLFENRNTSKREDVKVKKLVNY
jgi:hypothetical protein